MLRQYGFAAGTAVLSLFNSDAGIKAHPNYKAAKSGEPEAALALNIDFASIVEVGRNPHFIPNPQDVRIIKERFQDECIEIFGIQPDALTANEARYPVGFRSVDEIRNCVAKARQEIDRRLRAKGISRSGVSEASLQPEAQQGLNSPFNTL